MNLKQYYLTKNECYKVNAKIKVKGLMLHSTGANNPNLKRYLPDFDGTIGKNAYGNHWNQLRPGGIQVCVHGFIGKLEDGSVATVQTLPWTTRGWHAAGSANDTHIGVEICEDGLKDSNYFNKVYKEAVELFAYLCKKFNLNPMKDIVCHCEGYKKGIASNHSDVMHWFPKHGKSMDTFRKDVKIKMGVSSTKTESTEKKPAEKKTTIKGTSTNYTVKITADVLNVRTGPGTNYDISDKEPSVKRGEVYTIISEKNGWGKLKSGAGWIKLSYTNKTTAKYKTPTKTTTKKLTVGSKVKIKTSASKYCTGEKIPASIKGKKYTVQQIGTSKYPNGVLLKEIISWVNKSDLSY